MYPPSWGFCTILSFFSYLFILIDIEPEFQQQLRIMIPRILDSSNLAMKEINGHKVTCRELVEYFKVSWIEIVLSCNVPGKVSLV